MTKVFNKRNAKRITAILLAVVAVVSSIFIIPTASAAGKEVTVTFDYCYDTGGNIISFVKYTEHGGYTVGTVGEELCRIYADGKDAYCIEPGHSLYSGNTLTTDASAAWNALSKAQKKAVNLALLFGKSGSSSSLVGTDGQKWIATQLVVWEFCTGCRDASTFKLSNSKFIDGITAGDHNPNVKTNYNKIIAKLNSYNVIPSFSYDTQAKAKSNVKELKYSDGKYTLTLTDSKNILSDYTFKKTGNVSVSVSGNKITLISSKAIPDAVVFSATKNMPKVTTTLVACGSSSKQDVVTGVQSDTETKTAYFAVKTSAGSLKIVKTSDDGMVDGIKFKITGADNYSKTVTTNSKGEFQLDDLKIGTYTVTEVTEERYEDQKAQTVKVESGKTATVKFSNVLKRGNLQVVKSSEDNFNEGVKFHLYGTSLSGAKVDEYATTDKNGIANFKNILVSGDNPYTLEEVDTSIRYVVPKSQTAPVVWDKVTKREFINVLKKFTVTVEKTDAEAKKAQGDATLAGAKYGIYDGDKLVDTYTTDKDGKFTTKEYVCGDNWTIREIEPSEGYLLNETVYNVGAEAKNYTVEHNPISVGVTEQIIKGEIEIVKHTDQGQTKIETPEEGATFQLFLKSAGSFDKANDSERDTLICDEKGYAKSKKLPYGTYTVHQTYGWEGRHYVDDFDVFVCDNSKPYSFIINNDIFESYLKVVKVDAESGRTIPYEGAGFQIYAPDNTLITMSVPYPSNLTIDTFYTNSDGYLITPEMLVYDKGYKLVEVQAPHGYVLDSTPITFDITEENSTEEGSIVLTKVNKANYAQKGKITIAKEGEVFYGVNVSGGTDDEGNEIPTIYQPVYETAGLKGATYEIRAAEDIITPDGTVRNHKGDLVDTVTTGNDGFAKSKALYLGKYEIKEIHAPYGMVLSDETHNVELVYADQTVEITETSTSFYNERQKVNVNLEKWLETNEPFDIGTNEKIKNISFGLFATEELVSASGTTIPADGLIEIITLDENGNGFVGTDLPFGSYYVKELATDEHYILTDTKFPVVFEYEGENTKTVDLTVNDGEPITNELIYGTVSGKKIDENGEALGGAVIGLFKSADAEFTAENATLTTESAEDGSFTFGEDTIPYGTWYVREIEQPTGFVLNDAVYPVTIGKDGDIVEIEIVNEHIRGNIKTTKVDADYPDNKLTGAVFEIYSDTNANGKLDKDDKLLSKIKETDTGIYEMDDLVYGHYLVKEKKAPDGFILDENTYPVFIETDGKTYDVENDAGKGFLNEAMKGSLKIIKTSSDNKVKGISFRVTGENGFDKVFKTDKNGEILIEGLRIGKYVVSEVNDDASAGYILPDDEVVEIEYGKTASVKMHNEKIHVPQTGDDSAPGSLWLMIGGISAAGIAACVTALVRKSKKHNKEAA